MKIAIDTSPLYNANANRGVGMYTRQLLEGLKSLNDSNEYILIKDPSELNSVAPDLIHYPFFDLFFPTLPKKQTIPVVVTVHDVTPLVLPDLFPPGIKGTLKLFFQKQRLRQVDKIITDSLCSKRDIAHYLNIPENKIEVVYLGADEIYRKEENQEKLTKIREKYALPDKYIIKVGDINKHKNFHRLFDAVTRIDPDIHLILVGKALDEKAEMIPELQEITEDIQNFSLQKRVHRLGFVPIEDMPALYTMAKAAIVNSIYEGFGLPALEAMMCKTPVIGSNAGSIPEIIGSAGILIDPYDPDDTAQAIEKIFSLDADVYKTVQDKSYEQSKKFSLQKMTRETVQAYESLQTNHR